MRFSDLSPLVWPLTMIFIVLMILRAIGDDLKAFTRWVAVTVGSQASKQAMFYVIAIGFGMQAFGTGFYDNFWPLDPPEMAKLGWWQVLAAVLKSMSFAIGIMVGYALKDRNNETKPDATTTSTTEIKTETTATPKT